jgi:vesicle coat complex subunit|tara:strand:- start:540 stop:890 length:351 start_codon:yes stop_codon:yes gene_type:complete
MSLAGDWSSLGLIPFLVYAHVKAERRSEKQEAKIEDQRKEADARFEALAKGWQRQLDTMTEKQEAREADIRDRWTAIVDKLESQKAEQSDKIIAELKELSTRVEDVIRFISRPAGR